MGRQRRSPPLAGYRLQRAEALTRGEDAAARVRAELRARGKGECVACGGIFLASALDVDHIVPIARGGEDATGNVQVLCRAVCHAAKTRREFNPDAVRF